MPLLILANDALLLYSNFGVGYDLGCEGDRLVPPQPSTPSNQTIPQAGATVHVRIFDGDSPDGQGRTVDSAPLYTITLGRAIRDMWNAKAYFTSVLIAGECVRGCVRALRPMVSLGRVGPPLT